MARALSGVRAWDSLVEERAVPATAGAGAAAASARSRGTALAAAAGPRLYEDIDTVVSARLPTGIDEFDRVLGGGVVPGSLVLIGGEPGIGKSTLLLQAAAHFAGTIGPVLYSSGEESEHQIKSRGERLGVARAPLYLLAETCLERILEEIARLTPALIIVDSVQTVFSLKFQSAPGQHRPGARGGHAAALRRQGAEHPDLPRRATSRRTAAWPARKCSSTSSTRCSTSRGRSIIRTASCAR